VKRFFVLIGLQLLCIACLGQKKIRGVVLDEFSKRAIPFATVRTSCQTAITDINGRFTMAKSRSMDELSAETPIHKEVGQQVVQDDSVALYLKQTSVQFFEKSTSPGAKILISNVLRFAYRNDPLLTQNYTFTSYNKLVVNTDMLSEAQKQARGLLSRFRIKIDFPKRPHHLFLMESATEGFMKNRIYEKEEVHSSRAAGLNSPPPFSIASGLQPFSIYRPFLNIAGGWFISPLGGNPFKRYHFQVIDTLQLATGTTYQIYFNPKGNKLLETTAGYLWVDSATFGIQAFSVSPALMGGGKTRIYQLNTLMEHAGWMPVQTMTTFEMSNLLGTNIPLLVKNKTYLFNYLFKQKFGPRRFDNVLIDFVADSSNNENYLRRLRQEPFSAVDTATIDFYDQLGKLENIDRVVNFGNRLAHGRFPLNKFDIVLNRAWKANDFEGLRLGLGFETSRKFSLTHKFGGYFGYGFGDTRWKYGLDYRYNLFDRWESYLELRGGQELQEPGSVSLPFPRLYFSNENLRDVLILRYDMVRKAEALVGFTPVQNLNVKSGFVFSERHTLYNYSFNNFANRRYHYFLDWVALARYSPGERFIRINGEKISIGNRWPEVWAQVTKGFDGPLGKYNYVKLDGRLASKFRILGLGETAINVTGGWVNRPAPYPVLFNARGSYRDFSFVAFNSFETMRYNEFTTSEYLNFFLVHRFRRIYIPNFPFRPYFSLVANGGWGYLNNKDVHQGILIQDYNKGYFESGFFVNDFFVVNLFGLRTGLGAGAFLRMGHYKQLNTADNVVFKFALNYSL
jgi:hypothetical protein